MRWAEEWLEANFRADRAVAGAVEAAGIPERSFKRRFRTATGNTLFAHVQNLRVEAAKRLLEPGDMAAEEVAPVVGYENGAFFRALFRRTTGLTPGQYRAMFRPLVSSVSTPDATGVRSALPAPAPPGHDHGRSAPHSR